MQNCLRVAHTTLPGFVHTLTWHFFSASPGLSRGQDPGRQAPTKASASQRERQIQALAKRPCQPSLPSHLLNMPTRNYLQLPKHAISSHASSLCVGDFLCLECPPCLPLPKSGEGSCQLSHGLHLDALLRPSAQVAQLMAPISAAQASAFLSQLSAGWKFPGSKSPA